MKVDMSTTLAIKHSTTAGELAELLASLPPEAKISIRQEKYYNQMDAGGTWITARWTEER